MAGLKELIQDDDLFVSGHGLCPGCLIPVILKVVLRATRHPLVIANASGCLQQASALYPKTSWKVNWIHTSYSNAASTMSGIETAYRFFKKRGRLSEDKRIKFLVLGGDGATYDAGLSAVSGAFERGHDIVYLCCDNQMNAKAGGSRSSASPMGADTNTTPAGDVLPGKLQFKKNITRIIASHRMAYVAQSAPWRWQDLFKKAKEALEIEGPAFLNVLSACPAQWEIPVSQGIEYTRLAAETCVWPLYEIKNGTQVTINYQPENKLPVTEWLKSQGRFTHLMKTENKWIVDKIQEDVDNEWELLQFLEKMAEGN